MFLDVQLVSEAKYVKYMIPKPKNVLKTSAHTLSCQVYTKELNILRRTINQAKTAQYSTQENF